MLSLPRSTEVLLSRFSIAFTPRAFQRVIFLVVGMIPCTGRHTVTAALRVMRPFVRGHYSSYHRVLSRARWSQRALAKVLAAVVLELVLPGEPAPCAGDDIADQHKGKHVW